MPHFGTLFLHLSLLATALATPLFFRARGEGGVGLGAARSLAAAAAAWSTSALALLALAALTHDFRIEYIASYTDRATDPLYLLTSIWAGQAGSLAVWACILAWLTVGLSSHLRRQAPDLEPAAAGFMLLTQGFFLVILVGWINPFMLLDGVEPTDGNGLNPLLRNLLMVFHPPALLAGYAAYAPPAAITAAALLIGRFDRGCLDALRHWSLLAWALLSLGNALGMVWAYGELGWGGYWGWDPVENASLIPWITGTALLHQILAERRHKSALGWSAVLALVTFWLTLFGTYLTRSGIVASVHAFGRTPIADAFAVLLAVVAMASFTGLLMRRRMLALPRGASLALAGRVAVGSAVLALGLELLPGAASVLVAPVLLASAVVWSAMRKAPSASGFVPSLAGFLITAALAGVLDPGLWPACGLLSLLLLLLGWRRGLLKERGAEALAGRPILLGRTVLLLVALAAGVLFGTLMPLTSELVTGDQVQASAAWYARWAAPAGLVLLGLTGVCLILGGGATLELRPRRQLPPAIAAFVAAVAAWLAGVTSPLALGALALAGLTGWTALQRGATLIAGRRAAPAPSGRRLPAKLGAVLAHLGLAVLFLGLSGEADKDERTLELSRDGAVTVGGMALRLEGVELRQELDLEALRAVITVTDQGGRSRVLRPERRRYRSHPEQPTSEAAVWSDLGGDLFLTLGQVTGEDGAEQVWVRAVLTPRLAWIWIGCALMTLAGLLAVIGASKPRSHTLITLGAAAATTVGTWLVVRPSSAMTVLAAFTMVLGLWWLGRALIPPLLGGASPADSSDPELEREDVGSEPASSGDATCPECRASLVPGSRFCHTCGAEVDRGA